METVWRQPPPSAGCLHMMRGWVCVCCSRRGGAVPAPPWPCLRWPSRRAPPRAPGHGHPRAEPAHWGVFARTSGRGYQGRKGEVSRRIRGCRMAAAALPQSGARCAPHRAPRAVVAGAPSLFWPGLYPFFAATLSFTSHNQPRQAAGIPLAEAIPTASSRRPLVRCDRAAQGHTSLRARTVPLSLLPASGWYHNRPCPIADGCVGD